MPGLFHAGGFGGPASVEGGLPGFPDEVGALGGVPAVEDAVAFDVSVVANRSDDFAPPHAARRRMPVATGREMRALIGR
jgi:hypothetical protein